MDRTTAFGDVLTVVTVGPCGGENNFSYLVIDNATGDCAVTDPSQCVDDINTLLDGAKTNAVPWTLKQVLTTHHHWDHAFSNQKMADRYPGLEVIGGEEDEVEACTKRVKDGDEFTLGKGITITALNTRGHTDGHICYLVTTADAANGQAVFTGDTMFVGGCGRCFEGTIEDLWVDLTKRLGELKPETKVFVGHEYTVKNYEFGCAHDPTNADMKARLEWARATQASGGVTVPTTIAEEWKTNIFLRCADPDFLKAFPDVASSEDLFKKLRKLKDGTMNITTEMLKTMNGMIPAKFRK